jgi:hypothetical protein
MTLTEKASAHPQFSQKMDASTLPCTWSRLFRISLQIMPTPFENSPLILNGLIDSTDSPNSAILTMFVQMIELGRWIVPEIIWISIRISINIKLASLPQQAVAHAVRVMQTTLEVYQSSALSSWLSEVEVSSMFQSIDPKGPFCRACSCLCPCSSSSSSSN